MRLDGTDVIGLTMRTLSWADMSTASQPYKSAISLFNDRLSDMYEPMGDLAINNNDE